MTWHETIQSIRCKPEYNDLVRLAYFDSDLRLNVQRFGTSDEFVETLKIIKEYAPKAKNILDIGAGNGISSVNFALKEYNVTAVEPDPSNSVGANAIRILREDYKLDNLSVFENYAEEIGFEKESFDIVYVRQAMHHANKLKKFVAECTRVLKPGGFLLTIRDHVIFSNKDKEWFLQMHPLHKYYGGENAFTAKEYKEAMSEAGLKVIKEIKYFDSVINYFPRTEKEVIEQAQKTKQNLKAAFKNKVGLLSNLPGVFHLYRIKNNVPGSFLNERDVPGRMYSYIAQKE